MNFGPFPTSLNFRRPKPFLFPFCFRFEPFLFPLRFDHIPSNEAASQVSRFLSLECNSAI